MQPRGVRHLPFIPYPAINDHGLVGDTRTAALVARDGTIDWMCLPDYEGPVVFGALLDCYRGGHFRVGPVVPSSGEQRYVDDTSVLSTRFSTAEGELELTDAMLWPEVDRPVPVRDGRVLVRRLCALSGEVECLSSLAPAAMFDEAPERLRVPGGFAFRRPVPGHNLGFWTSLAHEHPWDARFRLRAGDEVWFVLGLDEAPIDWSAERARAEVDHVVSHWQGYVRRLHCPGPRRDRMRRMALAAQLLGYAPAGSIVASPTLGLPERSHGPRNYDYRYAWVRDASLALHAFSRLGDLDTGERFLVWLSGLRSRTGAPLQVVYGVRGGTRLRQRRLRHVFGYRGTRPLTVGNRAWKQKQLGSLGYLADGALTYVQRGGRWRPEFSRLVARCAAHTARHWREPDAGIWELTHYSQYASSKVMCWATLDRALQLHDRLGDVAVSEDERQLWECERAAIFDHVMTERWDSELCTFCERDKVHATDAALLLLPIMGMLPGDDPRVRSTVRRIVESLTIDGFVYRFAALEMPGEEPLPVGEFEGAFLPCLFWLATAYALAGEIDHAEAAMDTAEQAASRVGLFAEEYDPRSRVALGNYPLLFTLAEYIRSALAIEDAREAAGR